MSKRAASDDSGEVEDAHLAKRAKVVVEVQVPWRTAYSDLTLIVPSPSMDRTAILPVHRATMSLLPYFERALSTHADRDARIITLDFTNSEWAADQWMEVIRQLYMYTCTSYSTKSLIFALMEALPNTYGSRLVRLLEFLGQTTILELAVSHDIHYVDFPKRLEAIVRCADPRLEQAQKLFVETCCIRKESPGVMKMLIRDLAKYLGRSSSELDDDATFNVCRWICGWIVMTAATTPQASPWSALEPVIEVIEPRTLPQRYLELLRSLVLFLPCLSHSTEGAEEGLDYLATDHVVILPSWIQRDAQTSQRKCDLSWLFDTSPTVVATDKGYIMIALKSGGLTQAIGLSNAVWELTLRYPCLRVIKTTEGRISIGCFSFVLKPSSKVGPCSWCKK